MLTQNQPREVITAADVHNAGINFQPPIPAIGQIVVVYLDGVRDKSRMTIAAVKRIMNKTIEVGFLGSSEGRKAVKHIDDPRLQMHQAQQESGAWDFTDDWYERAKAEEYILNRMEELFQRTEKVEEFLEIKHERNPMAQANHKKALEFQALRRKAKEMGCDKAFTMTKVEIQSWIEAEEKAIEERKAKAEADRLAAKQAAAEETAKKSNPKKQPSDDL